MEIQVGPQFSHVYVGVSINGDTPIAGWFMVENPNLKWIVTKGTSISGNLHVGEQDESNIPFEKGWFSINVE